MPIITYVSEQCQKDAKKFQATDALNKLQEKIETEQALWNLEPFTHPFWVKKKLAGKNNRLICRIEKQTINGIDYEVLIFLTILLRSNQTYVSFYENTTLIGNQFYQDYINPLEVSEHINELLKNNRIKNKPTLFSAAKNFLYEQVKYSIDGSTALGQSIVYESWSWFECVSNLVNKDLILIQKKLETRLDDPTERVILHENEDYLFVLYNFTTHNINYLSVELKNNIATLSERNISYKKLRSKIHNSEEFNELIKKSSRRSYIQEVCTDFEIWHSIQTDLASNLVFSPEELSILKSIQDNKRPFPLFINGRAGSGKSTMLQVLFTEYLFMAYKNYQDEELYPIYLSYNQSLTNKAISTINSLIKTKKSEGIHNLSNIQINALHHCYEFKSYLNSLLPAEEETNFSQSHYINYSKFRQLWNEKFKRHLQLQNSVSLSWHIIRSLIKGLHSDNYLEYDDYLDLSKARKQNISADNFKTIYETVWLNWYKPLCERENYWDDQDLARFVLEKNLIKKHYPAIFCDESQDFTPIEFQILLRLNTFSHYQIDAKDIQRIPIVFAGDQFQTLNPTGFRWDNIKAQVVEQFIFSLDPTKSTTLSEINYQELTYNFRCSHNIAKFSNTVHGMRAKSLELKNLQPQKSWHIKDTSQNVLFVDQKNNALIEKIKSQYDLIIILPCLEDEEFEYIKANPALAQLFDEINEQTKITSIPAHSVIRSKGLEFKRIVIYGFGQEAYKLHTPQDSNEQRISLEYYLNRLYVAVTRAKEQLWIIDTKENYDNFWANFVDPATSQFNLQALETQKTAWVKELGTLKIARDVDLVANSNQEVDMQENAEKLKSEGLNEKDAYLLGQAAGLFEKLSDPKQRDYCLAEAAFIDRKFSKAADLFETIKNYKRSFESHWCDQNLDALDIIIQKNLLDNQFCLLEIKIIKTLKSKQHKASDFTSLYNELLSTTKITDSKEHLDTWSEFLAQSFALLLKYKTQDWDWGQIFSTLIKFKDQLYFSPSLDLLITKYQIDILAEVSYLANNFEKAYQFWQISKKEFSLKPTTPQYEKSCIQVLSFPETIPAFLTLKDDNGLLAQIKSYKTPDNIYSEQWQEIIRFLSQSHLKDHFKCVFDQYLPLTKETQSLQYITTYAKNHSITPSYLDKINLIYLFRCCINGNWNIISQKIKYFENQKLNLNHLSSNNKSIEFRDAKQLEVILYGLFLSSKYPSTNQVDDKDINFNKEVLDFLRYSISPKHTKRKFWKTDIKESILIGGILEKSHNIMYALSFYKELSQEDSASIFSKQRCLQILKTYKNLIKSQKNNQTLNSELKNNIYHQINQEYNNELINIDRKDNIKDTIAKKHKQRIENQRAVKYKEYNSIIDSVKIQNFDKQSIEFIINDVERKERQGLKNLNAESMVKYIELKKIIKINEFEIKIKKISRIIKDQENILNINILDIPQYPEITNIDTIIQCIIKDKPFNYTPVLIPEVITSKKVQNTALKDAKTEIDTEDKSFDNQTDLKEADPKPKTIRKKLPQTKAIEEKQFLVLSQKITQLETMINEQQDNFDTTLAAYHSQIESLKAFTAQQTQYIETMIEQHLQDAEIIEKLNQIINSQQKRITKALTQPQKIKQ